MSGRRPSRRALWSVLVPVVAMLGGLLFATSSRTAAGTDLRAGDGTQLSSLIAQRNSAIGRQQQELTQMQRQIQELTTQAGSRNGEVAQAQAQGDTGLASAGLTGLTGAGVQITLDDAPRPANGGLPTGATPDDVVIHQSDVQGVVNALWAAGADGVAIMGRRLIATSAIRCVGSTLLLQGRTYSPPFVVTAIGPADQMREQLGRSTDVELLQQAVDDFGLTYQVRNVRQVTLPAYDGALDLQYAHAG